MDTAPAILKQKIVCTCCKNIHTITVNSQNMTKKKLIIMWGKPPHPLTPPLK